MAKNVPNKDIKTLSAITGLLLALILLVFTVFNLPQCPDYYTQQQVDASSCIVGANIGLGLLIIFVLIPLVFFVGFLWALAIYRATRKRSKKRQEKTKKSLK